MHPIVPVIMSLGAILFLIGIGIQAWFGVKRINTIKLRGKEYKLWQFVAVTAGLGTTLFMISVLIPKYIPYQPEQAPQTVSVLPENLKYELESTLSSLNLNNDAMKAAINRFQIEYQMASQKGDKNTMDLLALEMAYRVRMELEKREIPESRIEREVERVLAILKQPAKQDGK
ncbi:MAG: hypothetical protein HRU77_02295 [Gammaproteobacteria bacterium]|nr:MAG: hypothetical protein HRU77_02295 [Gammaproteobacteria bacterium]